MTALAQRLRQIAAEMPERCPPWFFGIGPLDDVVKGVRAGFTNLIVARSHVGKTKLVLDGIRNNPEVPTMFISADDTPDVAVRKIMFSDSVVASVDAAWKLSADEMAEHMERNYPRLDIVDDVAWGPAAMNNQIELPEAIRRFEDEHGDPPYLIVYDYLGIDGQNFDSNQMVTVWMKQTARILPAPMLTICQSHRLGQKGRTIKESDGTYTRRGFEMEDLSFGGEAHAGAILGLIPNRAWVAGREQMVIEVDVVKNKAVFDGTGVTDRRSPVVLCHQDGRLVDRLTAEHREFHRNETARREAMNGHRYD